MEPIEKAAYIMACAANVFARVSGMNAENMAREHLGEAMAYNQAAFDKVPLEEMTTHNQVIGLLRS